MPKNYFKDINTLTDPQFKWEKVQQLYFKNWLQKTAEYSQNALTIA
ncbi:homoserine O-succinyltransferase [Blautia sp. DFI.9.9]|nr:homoserine O-succinyltransferase [Blautia sp. DFI.9.9]